MRKGVSQPNPYFHRKLFIAKSSSPPNVCSNLKLYTPKIQLSVNEWRDREERKRTPLKLKSDGVKFWGAHGHKVKSSVWSERILSEQWQEDYQSDRNTAGNLNWKKNRGPCLQILIKTRRPPAWSVWHPSLGLRLDQFHRPQIAYE